MSESQMDTGVASDDEEIPIDPINDIIDYLVRCAKISFKNAHVDQNEVKTSDKIKMAYDLYIRSPTEFLLQFGKFMAPKHIEYFETLPLYTDESFRDCVLRLKDYHSDVSRYKRVRNRRYNALQEYKNKTDYFSEKQMMYRNPLLYEQLVGQYMTENEIKERDGVDTANLTFLNLILETVDRNNMREIKNEQELEENLESVEINNRNEDSSNDSDNYRSKKQWGEFDAPDTRPQCKPERRNQCMISAPERDMLKQEFVQEMYSSFIEGQDVDIDYNGIDNNDQYDDLHLISQDAEDKYFDSETNDTENLEEHMKLVQEYGRKNSDSSLKEDPLDIFMEHVSNKLKSS